MQEMLELALKRIETLEKKLEKYVSLLKINNELDFIINGSYLLKEEIDSLCEGSYGEVASE